MEKDISLKSSLRANQTSLANLAKMKFMVVFLLLSVSFFYEKMSDWKNIFLILKYSIIIVFLIDHPIYNGYPRPFDYLLRR
jgi:hypothetical protein